MRYIMTRSGHRLLLPFLFWVVFLFISTATASAYVTTYLTVTNDAGETLLELDLTQTPTWSVRWNHSVTGILVEDYYALQNGHMVLTQSHTPDFAAGLGYIRGRGRLESDASHGYWIRDINEPVPGNRYALRVGSLAVNHRIVQGDYIDSLSERAAGERVWLELRQREP